MKDFYHILATDVSSTSLEIQKAYEYLLQSFHPELNRNNKQFKHQFKEIHEAYEVLIDPDKRRKYDQKLKQVKSNFKIEVQPKQQYYTKAIDITFTIILIFFTFVFGDFVIKSINHAKVAKSKKAVIAKISSIHLSKPQRKKHGYKIKTANSKSTFNSPILKPDTIKSIKIAEDKSTSIIPPANTDLASNIDKDNVTPKISNDDNKVNNKAGFLHETSLKANETGVVNLRETAHYNAAVIRVIPTGSNVFVLEKGNNYYKVKFENNTGYVPRWTIEKQ